MTRDGARRGNLREHGEPERGIYFGRDPRRPVGDGVPVHIAREGRAIRLRDTSNQTVEAFGDTAKFWLAEVPGDPAPTTRPAAPTHTPPAAAPGAGHAAATPAGPAVADQHAARTAALATSYRLTAEALTAAAGAPVPVRQTWADAGRPTPFLYYERGFQPGRPILATTTDGYRIHDVRTGEPIAHVASPITMWIAAAPAPPVPGPVVIVGCGAAKNPGRLPAGRKYVGGFHRAARRAAATIADRTGGQVLVLSARYGLIPLDTEIDDYDLRLGDPGAVTPAQIAEQAKALGITTAAVTVLAGRRYADLVNAVWPDANRPLDGARGIGDQLARMKAITQQASNGAGREQQPDNGPA